MSTLDPNLSFDEAVPTESNYLKKEDVGEGGKNLTIFEFKRLDVSPNNAGEMKTVLFFKENYKPMILNKTNANRLVAINGSKLMDSIGQVVNVFNDPMIEFGGNITGGIRIRKVVDKGPEDEVPF